MTELFNRAELKSWRRELMHNATEPERYLWSHLRHSQLDDVKFRRQASIAAYVVDFYAPQLRLAIEVDGPTHDGDESRILDYQRQKSIEDLGISFLKFKNQEVLDNPQ